jgi:large subunit ribosomal protein L22
MTKMGLVPNRQVKRKNTADDAPEFRAIHWNAKISPRKARLVMDLVRGLPVSEALDVLKFDRHRGAYLIDRVLKSAIANADQAITNGKIRSGEGDLLDPQPDVDVDDLYIHDARIDDGPRLKRWKPRARGQAYPYQKYYAHITIRLRPRPPAPAPKKKPTAAAAAGKK